MSEWSISSILSYVPNILSSTWPRLLVKLSTMCLIQFTFPVFSRTPISLLNFFNQNKDDVFLINYQFSYPDFKLISLFHLCLCIYFEVTDSLVYWGRGGSNRRTEIYTEAPISVPSSLCQHEASCMLHVGVEDTEVEHSTTLELWGS